MKATHDQHSYDFEARVSAYIAFFHQIGERKAAEYCAHQDATIAGLTRNNDSFIAAYQTAAEHGVHPTGGRRGE